VPVSGNPEGCPAAAPVPAPDPLEALAAALLPIAFSGVPPRPSRLRPAVIGWLRLLAAVLAYRFQPQAWSRPRRWLPRVQVAWCGFAGSLGQQGLPDLRSPSPGLRLSPAGA
jgi:hypothetical protein